MIEKNIKIGDINIYFYLFHKPYYMTDDTIVLGFPLGMSPETFGEKDVDDVKGYYAHIKISNDKLQIINDICGHCRLYYHKKDNTILFSDDFLTLADKIGKENRTKNQIEIDYWNTQRKTTGGDTFIKEIHKIKPAHITTLFNNKFEEKLYFKNIKNQPNKDLHALEVFEDMRDTFTQIKELPQKKILLYSGGTDSTLLVKLLQEQNIDFIPVFMKSNDDFLTISDENKVIQAAEKLNIVVDIINIDKEDEDTNYFVKRTILDKGIHVFFYNFIKKIKEKYGEDVVIINGEGSDTIFNFLPTSQNIDHILCRTFMFKPCSLIGNLGYLIVKLYAYYVYLSRIIKNPKSYQRPLYIDTKYPSNINEFLLAFSYRICVIRALIDTTKSKEFYEYIQNRIDLFKGKLSNIKALLMYLEMYFNWQGCDPHTDIYSVLLNELKVVLPFNTPKIIYSTVKNTDYKNEILNPKSVTYRILKNDFNFKFTKLNKDKKYLKQIKNKKTNNFEKNRYELFYKELDKIVFNND